MACGGSNSTSACAHIYRLVSRSQVRYQRPNAGTSDKPDELVDIECVMECIYCGYQCFNTETVRW